MTTIQYDPATDGFIHYHTLPSITLIPGQTYLIQEDYGFVNQYEGSGAVASTTILNSITRISNDSNNNANDFIITLPSPSSSVLAINDFNNAAKQSHFIKNIFVKNNEITFGADVKDVKVYNSTGQLVKTASVKEGAVLNVAELQKGNYIVTGTVNNQPISQKILKD